MEISGPNNRPFIIRRNQNRTLLPPESPNFDEKVENYVRFVQGANAFIAFFEIYETIRVIYLYFVYQDQCTDYTHFLIALAILNLIWILGSFSGIAAINSRGSSRIACFLYMLFFIVASRIAFYIVMEIKMSDLPDTEWYCDSIYQGGLYIITAILEAVVIVTVIFLTFVVKNYIQVWELSQETNMQETNYLL